MLHPDCDSGFGKTWEWGKSIAFFFCTGIIIDMYHTSKWSGSSVDHIPTSQHSHCLSQYQCSSFEWGHVSLPIKFCGLLFLIDFLLRRETINSLRPWWGSEQESDKLDPTCQSIMSSFCMTMLDHRQVSGQRRQLLYLGG